ncbi:protein GumF [Xanthomonas fragariae]|nr:protein GumF [Xanthomonas fragariae]
MSVMATPASLSAWQAAGYASRMGLSQTVSKQARSLLLTYVTFYLLGYVYWLLTRNIGEKAARWVCTHMLVFFAISGVAALSGGFGASRPGLGWAVFVTLFALAACVPLRWVLMRFAHWTLGARPVVT